MAHRQTIAAAALARSCSPPTPAPPTGDLRDRRERQRSGDRHGARGKNLVWLAPDANRRVGKLLVFLPLGGAEQPARRTFESIGSEGGRLGYHTIVLAYKNEVPVAKRRRPAAMRRRR